MQPHALIIFAFICSGIVAQTNIHFSNADISQILGGAYDPGLYAASTPEINPHNIVKYINDQVSADSLKAYLLRLSKFKNRNTGSDTVSNKIGIGAARRLAFHRLQQISSDNENRLIVGYLNWDRAICGMNKHRNVVAVLPGMDTVVPWNSRPGVIIIEAHLDSRCDVSCDTGCVAQGIDDNGSGTALVLELARVLAKNQFNRTIIFMLTTAEEQGLYGGEALAKYLDDNNINVAAVFNNDVVGGVFCGYTSSPPSCPGHGEIDSTHLRLFSAGTYFSLNKQLARYTKLQYQEELLPLVKVPMELEIMTGEDRSGRGGDHIPFRQHGFAAIRFTSANESGDGNPSQSGYNDRQHTSDDLLGVDTNGDNIIDSFYIDFNYLARNAAVNGVSAAMIAQNVCTPEVLQVEQTDWKTLQVTIAGDYCPGQNWRVALHTETNDWDTLIDMVTNVGSIEVEPGHNYFISAASRDSYGIESLFTQEVLVNVVGIDEPKKSNGIRLLQNRPNPFDESTSICFIVDQLLDGQNGLVEIHTIDGALIKSLPVTVKQGLNEVIYEHGFHQSGSFQYSLWIGGRVIDTKKMVFIAN